jgi:hypothetical protein
LRPVRFVALALVVVTLAWGRPSMVTAQTETATTATTRPALWPWAIVGVGGAMFVASAVMGGLTLERQAELDRVCSPHSCPPAVEAAQAEGRAFAFSTDALWVGGLVVVAVGFVLALTLPGEATTASAACGPDGCTLSVRGVF